MTRDKVFDVIKGSICEETDESNFELIRENSSADDIPGWDSLAHVRIMLNIEMELDVMVPIDKTYKVPNIGELVTLFASA